MQVLEQVLRLGRRGKLLRPFCQARHVQPRGYSRRLQRVLTDFGADDSFGAAAAKVLEHYAIEVPVSAVRKHTLVHGRAIAATTDKPLHKPAGQITTGMDGSMIPIMEPGSGVDQRKGKKLFWREARLCCARAVGREQACYGVTLGSTEVAGWVWHQTAKMAGLTRETDVHGVGDGAPWIGEQFENHFGDQGTYLIDFYHVSEYLAAAALKVARPGKERQWLHCQQGRLLQNKASKVLRALEPHLEAEGTSEEAPVQAAFRYLFERRPYLDYKGARAKGLPIGSGEVESGHRHVVQQRLKLSGCWWKETNAQSMLNLRAARANKLWEDYWLN